MTKTVLVIEYHHELRVAFRQALEACGYEVLSAATCRAGILALSSSYVDLIVLDLGIAYSDSLLQYRAERPDLIKVPIVALGDGPAKVEGSKFLRFARPDSVDLVRVIQEVL